MARIRTLKPEFPQSESMGRVGRDSRLTFILLWTLSDDDGKLRGSSRMLASLLFPYDDDARTLIDRWLDQLEKEHCIIRYQIAEDSYIKICNWHLHQKIDKPSQSKIPDPREESRGFANFREVSSGDQGRDQGPRTEGSKDQGPKESPLPPKGSKPKSWEDQFKANLDALHWFKRCREDHAAQRDLLIKRGANMQYVSEGTPMRDGAAFLALVAIGRDPRLLYGCFFLYRKGLSDGQKDNLQSLKTFFGMPGGKAKATWEVFWEESSTRAAKKDATTPSPADLLTAEGVPLPPR